MTKLGRPKGHYTQYRRLSQLRELLENHPKGLSLGELARKLHVTDRLIRRYLRELEREVDLERTPDPDGFGGVIVRIPTRDLPRRVKLHRTQIYGLLMARRVFRMLDGTTFEHELREAVDQLLSHVQRAPRRGAEIDPDTRLEDRFLYLPAAPMKPLAGDAAEVVDTVLDACAQLRERGVRPEQVERIDLRVHSLVLELTGKKEPQDGLQGKFSVYHGCAAGLIYGRAGEEEFSDAVVRDPLVVATRNKVQAVVDETIDEAEVRVSALLKSGERIDVHVEHAIGSLQKPLSDAQLQAKFEALVVPVLGQARAQAITQACWALGSTADVRALTALCRA